MTASENSRQAGAMPRSGGDLTSGRAAGSGAPEPPAWTTDACHCGHGRVFHDLNKARTARTACSMTEGRVLCDCPRYRPREETPHA